MCLSLILDLSPLSALLLGSRFVEILTQPTWAMILGKSRKQNPPKKSFPKKQERQRAQARKSGFQRFSRLFLISFAPST